VRGWRARERDADRAPVVTAGVAHPRATLRKIDKRSRANRPRPDDPSC
jgi:hypothetical protein